MCFFISGLLTGGLMRSDLQHVFCMLSVCLYFTVWVQFTLYGSHQTTMSDNFIILFDQWNPVAWWHCGFRFICCRGGAAIPQDCMLLDQLPYCVPNDVHVCCSIWRCRLILLFLSYRWFVGGGVDQFSLPFLNLCLNPLVNQIKKKKKAD